VDASVRNHRSGQYSQRIASDRRDELGRLGAAFNTMTEHVEEVHRELENASTGGRRNRSGRPAIETIQLFGVTRLRAPLRLFRVFSRILIDEHLAVLPGEAASYLRESRTGLNRWDSLIDDLAGRSRASGRSPVRRAR